MRLLPILSGGIYAIACLGATPGGYLTRVGPPPVRFQSIAQPSVPLVLPPLMMADSPPASAPNNQAEQPRPITNGSWTGNPSTAPATGPVALVNPYALLSPMDTNAPSEVTPMLMPYFLQHAFNGTNGNSALIVPLGFAPPMPAVTSPSSATYSAPFDPPRPSP